MRRNYNNPFKSLKKQEWIIWITSLLVITCGFFIVSDRDYITLLTSLIGVTALIFVAKGDPIGQILTVVFSILYAVISFSFRYYGEMITYLGMTTPIAIASAVSWLKNPYKKGQNEVKVMTVTLKHWLLLIFSAAITTLLFYFLLSAISTANIVISTISVTTSFLAAALTFFRSPLYGLGYAANDVILIIMWIMASTENPSYISMVICFTVFLINDCYGFTNWQQIKKRQNI